MEAATERAVHEFNVAAAAHTKADEDHFEIVPGLIDDAGWPVSRAAAATMDRYLNRLEAAAVRERRAVRRLAALGHDVPDEFRGGLRFSVAPDTGAPR